MVGKGGRHTHGGEGGEDCRCCLRFSVSKGLRKEARGQGHTHTHTQRDTMTPSKPPFCFTYRPFEFSFSFPSMWFRRMWGNVAPQTARAARNSQQSSPPRPFVGRGGCQGVGRSQDTQIGKMDQDGAQNTHTYRCPQFCAPHAAYTKSLGDQRNTNSTQYKYDIGRCKRHEHTGTRTLIQRNKRLRGRTHTHANTQRPTRAHLTGVSAYSGAHSPARSRRKARKLQKKSAAAVLGRVGVCRARWIGVRRVEWAGVGA